MIPVKSDDSVRGSPKTRNGRREFAAPPAVQAQHSEWLLAGQSVPLQEGHGYDCTRTSRATH